MDAGARRDRCGHSSAAPSSRKPDRDERVGDMQHQHQPIAPPCGRPPSAPAAPRAARPPTSSAMPVTGRDGSAIQRQQRERAGGERQPRRSARTAAAAGRDSSRTSQLRVKLGTMRPPISVIEQDHGRDADAHAVIAGAGPQQLDMPRRCCRAISTPSTPSTRRLRQFRPATISRTATAASNDQEATVDRRRRAADPPSTSMATRPGEPEQRERRQRQPAAPAAGRSSSESRSAGSPR